jgi:RNA polymerase sigma-70 factor, ECF subfamily
LVTTNGEEPPTGASDDRLALIFTCCHPALSMEARVALTLRSVGGLTTAEIARAFLVAERTMVQRLFRAKRKIRDAAIPFRVPDRDHLDERLDGVLSVLYLVFNEGYHATSGAATSRLDLSEEAIRLTSQLLDLLPEDSQVKGLSALMELHDARRAARVDAQGEIVALEDQDRALWDHERIARATRQLTGDVRRRYQLEASIVACHAVAPSMAATDWTEIARLYALLAEISPSPVVALNGAIAIGMADGPAVGLRMIEDPAISGPLAGYPFLPAARADMLRRLERFDEAAMAYREALRMVANDADRRFLERRLAEVSADLHASRMRSSTDSSTTSAGMVSGPAKPPMSSGK